MLRMKLNELLFKANMNQKDLSEKLNIPKNTVSKYCNNTFTMINKEHIDYICNFFQCDIGELIECTYNEKVNPNQVDMFNEIEESIKEQKFKQSLKKTNINIISNDSNESSRTNFFEYIQNKMGSLTNEEIHTYAILLGESPHKAEFSYKDTVDMITRINKQYQSSDKK